MFVPYEPDMVFDVERHSDRCVCGASATGTCHKPDHVNYGYCHHCGEKRKKFVEEVTSEIYIDKENSFEYSILNVIESLRQSIFQERFYYMVDKYFVEHQNDDEFKEPYEDKSFLAKVYREKRQMTKQFLSTITLQNYKKFSLSNKINTIYSYYKSELNKMFEANGDSLDELTADIGGYPYKKTMN